MEYFENVQRINDEVLLIFKDKIVEGEITYQDIDSEKILELSNQMIHDSSIFQEKLLLKYSTLLYCIGKMIARQKTKSRNLDLGPIFCQIYDKLKRVSENLKRKRMKAMERNMNDIFNLISKNDSKFNIYVQDIIHSTMIKKGSQLVQHGLSVETVSDLTGLNQWDLYAYLGKTNYETLLDEKVNKTERRLRHVKKLFKLKEH